MGVLDVLLGWLLNLHPALSILIISLLLSLVVTLALKFLTNQTLMKDMRNELKDLQKEMRELKNNPKKMAQINTRFMETNMKYMSHSMKPTLYTFIPILLVFGWLNSHLGYLPIAPGSPFEISAYFKEGTQGFVTIDIPAGINSKNSSLSKEIMDNEVRWTLIGTKEGYFNIVLNFKNTNYTKDILITNERKYAPVEKDFRRHFLFFTSDEKNGLNKISLSNKKILPFTQVPVVKDIPWISTWSWFGAYILFSLIFSMLLRKALNVY